LFIWRKGTRIIEKILGSDHPNILPVTNTRGVVLIKLGNYEEALTAFKEMSDKCKRTLGSYHPDTLIAESNIALFLDYQGEYDKPLEANEKVPNGRQRR
jgi:tetratricopeptide (TPR) repeat protein